MLRLAALGALGFFGYKFYHENVAKGSGDDGGEAALVPVAGGPLSDQATIQSTPDLLDTP